MASPAPAPEGPRRPSRGERFLPWLAALAALLPDPGAAWPTRTYFFRDFSVTFYPLRAFAARELQAGRWPAWNPFIYEGSFALPAIYPLDLLHAVAPSPVAVSWLLTLHLPLAALAAYWLARDLGARPRGGFVAAVVYALGGFCLSCLNLYVFLQALAVAPLVIGSLRRAALRGGRAVVIAGVALALALSTLAVEFVAQALLLGLALGLSARKGREAWKRLAFATSLGVGLAGLPVALTLGIVRDSVRGAGFGPEVALGNAVHPIVLLQCLVPDLFGSLAAPVDHWWGGAFSTKGLPYFLSLYVGPLVLLFALAGLAVGERGERRVILGAALLGLWFALGPWGGLAPLLAHLPLAGAVRFPSKALLLPHLAVAIFAGLGADRLARGEGWARASRGALALGALGLALAFAVGSHPAGLVAWASIEPARAGAVAAFVARGFVRMALLALLGVVAGLLVRAGRVPAGRATAAVTAVLVADLVGAGAGMNPQAPPSFFTPLPELQALRLDDPEGGRVFSYGLEESPAFKEFLARGSPGLALASFFVNRQILGPYNNVVDRVETPEATDLTSFVPRARELAPADYEPRRAGQLLPWLRNAAVTRVLSLDPLEAEGLRPLAAVPLGPPGLRAHAYRLADAWPRAFLACRVWKARDADDARGRPYSPGFDPNHDVALEPPGHGLPGVDCRQGTVTRLPGAPDEERFVVESDGAGYLLSRASFARGWTARVDGAPAAVLRANGKHRAVPVPRGRHEVVLRYRPPGLAVGLWLTAAGLASAAAAWWRAARAPAPGSRASQGRLSLSCPACGAPLRLAPPGARCDCGAEYAERDGVLDLARGGSGRPGYDPHYFATLPQVEDRHFWFISRREVIRDALEASVPDLERRALFDVGCGSGGLLAFLEGSGLAVAGACDAYPQGLALARRRVAAPLVLVDEGPLPPLGPGQSLVGLFDVLEHIDDDEGTLRFLFSVLEPGGVLVLTVPAHAFLFDEMDALAKHRRRYSRRDLASKLRAAGFEVRTLSHFGACLVPALVVERWLRRRFAPAVSASAWRDTELRVVPFLNGLLRGLLRVERSLLRVASFPFGSSLIAVAGRPARAPE